MNEKLNLESEVNTQNDVKSVTSVESIMQTKKDLIAKIEEAKRKKEESLNKQLNQREALLAELQRNEDLVSETNKGLEYFNKLSEEELSLLDDSTKKELDDFRGILSSLTKQSDEITNTINSMETNPDILGKLHEQATGEDNKIEGKKMEKVALEKYNSQIEEFVSELRKYGELKSKLWKISNESSETKRSIRTSFDEARSSIDKNDLRHSLDDIENKLEEFSPNELIKHLSELRAQLGFLDRKSKSAIDHVLSKEKVFEEYDLSKKEIKNLKDTREESRKQLSEKYYSIMENVNNEQKEINKLNGEESAWYRSIEGQLESKLIELLGNESSLISDWKNEIRNRN